jgi:hypothetical protein
VSPLATLAFGMLRLALRRLSPPSPMPSPISFTREASAMNVQITPRPFPKAKVPIVGVTITHWIGAGAKASYESTGEPAIVPANPGDVISFTEHFTNAMGLAGDESPVREFPVVDLKPPVPEPATAEATA